MVVRIADGDTDFDTLARIGAALCAGTQLAVSTPPGRNPPALTAARSVLDRPGIPTRFVTQSDAELAAAIAAGEVERIRYASSACVPAAIYSAAASTLVYLARTPVLAHGRIELLWYFREQSVSHAYHRYGNLGARAAEPREPVA
jgi:RHH-type proline utilization regulon transcriptional repressor/proline dehydrogenase/delta 1-pyrroline-5-carboxylate dehydrogenase